MTTELELPAIVKDLPPPARVAPLDSILKAVLQQGVTKENVEVIQKLVAIDAERRFAEAFVGLQAEMPAVKAMRVVPNRDGTPRYAFAPYEEIMQEVQPLLLKHGFTITFSTDFREGRLIKTCVLQHTSGHKRENSFAVRIGSGPPGCTETQADGAASTYAKRFALCDCLNITIEKEDAADAEGPPITPAQAEELRRRVRETGSNEAAFLKVAGINAVANPGLEHYREIPSSKYGMLTDMLAKKEARR